MGVRGRERVLAPKPPQTIRKHIMQRIEGLNVLATGRVSDIGKMNKTGRPFVLNVSRDYTEEEMTIAKQPIAIQSKIASKHAMKLNDLKDDDNIECNGVIKPVSYIWIPDGTKYGKRAVIPQAGETNTVVVNDKKITINGRSRPWEITAEEAWLKQANMCQVSTFIVEVDEITSIESSSTIDQLAAAIPQSEHALVMDDNAIAAMLNNEAEEQTELSDDTTIMMTDNEVKKQEQLFVSGVGKIYFPRFDKGPVISMNQRGVETVSRTFQLEIGLNERNPNGSIKQMQPIRMRCTVWDDLVNYIDGARNGSLVSITGFIDPWYILWTPNGTSRGKRIVIGEEGRDHGHSRPMDIVNSQTWNPNCHIQTTYQLTVTTVEFLTERKQTETKRETQPQARPKPTYSQEDIKAAATGQQPIQPDPSDPLANANEQLSQAAEESVNI